MNGEHGTNERSDDARSEFERRVAVLLNDSADGLDGRTRSALTRARHAALAQAARPRAALWRSWAPAGAVAAGLLVVMFTFLQQSGGQRPATLAANGAGDDFALVSDADAYDLSADGDMDLDTDFYEWAAGSANGASADRGLGG